MLRKSNNILLKKDDVGMAKPSTRDLPEFGHSYGLPGARDSEGVAKRKYFLIGLSRSNLVDLVTTVWTSHHQSNFPRQEKDFKQTNKLSLKKRATTAKAQSNFRKTFSNNLPTMMSKMRQSQVLLPEEAHPYGRPNRPGTPVGDVISNYYGEVAEKQISQKYDILKDTVKPMSLQYARGHTRASALAKSHVS